MISIKHPGKSEKVADYIYFMLTHIPNLSGPRKLNDILNDEEVSPLLLKHYRNVSSWIGFRFWAFVYRCFPNVKGVLDMNKPGEVNARRKYNYS